MQHISKKIIFFGTDDFSAPSLRALIAGGYTIHAVVTKPDSKSGRGLHITQPLVKHIALEHNIQVWQPATLIDITDQLKTAGDITGVLVSYGKIIPESIITLFTPGIINVHPSLLPKYRGSTPIESAILHGDTETGISIMQLTAGMDAGPVYAYTTVALDGSETQQSLTEKMANLSAHELTKVLPGILDGTYTAIPQDDTKTTYTKLLSKQDSQLNSDIMTAQQAEQKVRAHLNFPKTKTIVLGHDIIITKAHVSQESKTPLDVECRGGAFLSIDELIAPSGKTMNAEAFLNGYAA